MEEEAGDEDDEDDDEDEDDDDDDESEGESAEAQPGAAEAKSAAAEPVVAEAHRAAVARCCCGGWSVLSATRSVSGLASGCCKWDCSACAFASNSAASARGCCSRCALLQQRCEDGALDAAVVFADRRAVPFFKKRGFNDDPILNARYAEVLEPCARWSQQLPPPMPDGISGEHSSWASQEPLGQQLAAWRHARLLDDLHPVRTIWGAPRTTIWSFWS